MKEDLQLSLWPRVPYTPLQLLLYVLVKGAIHGSVRSFTVTLPRIMGTLL